MTLKCLRLSTHLHCTHSFVGYRTLVSSATSQVTRLSTHCLHHRTLSLDFNVVLRNEPLVLRPEHCQIKGGDDFEY